MSTYHKIQTVFKRDPDNNFKTLLDGQYSLPEFKFLENNKWVFTEKVDGTNIRIYILEDGEIRVEGRTDKANIPGPLMERINAIFEPLKPELMGMAGTCFYGEGYGGKIQKPLGMLYRPDQDFVLFDVTIDGKWMDRDVIECFAIDLDLDVVPIMGTGTLLEMVEQAKQGIRSTWGDFEAEGYIARPETELMTARGHRIITKIKCRDFR